jgi:hypothetical protein
MDPEISPVKSELNYDELQLQAQGHEQDMPRRFSLWTMFAIAFTITSSWVGFSTSVGISLLYGGPAAVVYGQIVGALSCALITLGLAELASAYPSSGGLCHFSDLNVRPISLCLYDCFPKESSVFGMPLYLSDLGLYHRMGISACVVDIDCGGGCHNWFASLII